MTRLFLKIKNKLNNKRGESLVETLGSLLIIVPAMIMLAGALVTASKINYEVRHADNLNLPTFTAGTDAGNDSQSISVLTGETATLTYNWKKEGLYYYFN